MENKKMGILPPAPRDKKIEDFIFGAENKKVTTDKESLPWHSDKIRPDDKKHYSVYITEAYKEKLIYCAKVIGGNSITPAGFAAKAICNAIDECLEKHFGTKDI